MRHMILATGSPARDTDEFAECVSGLLFTSIGKRAMEYPMSRTFGRGSLVARLGHWRDGSEKSIVSKNRGRYQFGVACQTFCHNLETIMVGDISFLGACAGAFKRHHRPAGDASW